MNTQDEGIRKAAILVAGLDRTTADTLLEQMDVRLAQTVRDCILSMDDVDPAEERLVIEEFLRASPRTAQTTPPEVEIENRLARKLSEELRPGRPDTLGTDGDSKVLHFRFLREAEDDKLARLLLTERSQTVALVLSHLPPEQAGNVLAKFPAPLQVDVIRRLVDLEETAPEILEEVEKALESRISDQLLTQRRRVAGLSAVAGIINASNDQVSREILANLNSHDRTLADRLSPDRPTFDDICRLDTRTLQTVLASLDPRLISLALLGSPPSITELLLAAIPAIQSRQIRTRLAKPEPTRLSDVEEARSRIADHAHQLAVSGRIELHPTDAVPTNSPAAHYVVNA